MKIALILLLLGFANCNSTPGPDHHRNNAVQTPQFYDSYSVEGLLSLPYAELNEPFTAYYEGQNGKSRVDYYGDLVQTIQRAADTPFGSSYKIAYTVDNEFEPRRVCFQTNGSSSAPVNAQTVLPDLSSFHLVAADHCPFRGGPSAVNTTGSGPCERWEFNQRIGEKENKYTFWLQRDSKGNPVPIHYQMKGYDSLLGSHYDHYEISYTNYRKELHKPEIFDVPTSLSCSGYPGPGLAHAGLVNPIKEFVHNDGTHIDTEFDNFKVKHGKKYRDGTHHQERKNIFRHNYRFIQSKNRANSGFQLAVNHLADFTVDELRILNGRRFSGSAYNGGKPFNFNNKTRVPSSWNWRLLGAVNPVKDQAVCGSCWSFGTTGTIEGVYFVKTGHLLSLSEQQLIDCSWNQGDNGCDGGEDFRAYDYIIKSGGLSTDEEYGSYLGIDGKCHELDSRKAVQLAGFVNVTSGDADSLRQAVYLNGPVTVGIDASQRSFSFYSHGVYYDPKCGNTPEALDHQVLVVGYGIFKGQKYWIVKNSWSTYWGTDGYVLMSEKDNNCGVMTSPTYPIIA